MAVTGERRSAATTARVPPTGTRRAVGGGVVGDRVRAPAGNAGNAGNACDTDGVVRSGGSVSAGGIVAAAGRVVAVISAHGGHRTPSTRGSPWVRTEVAHGTADLV